MPDDFNEQRRLILRTAALGAALMAIPALASSTLEPLKHVDAGVLNIAYYEVGPAPDGVRAAGEARTSGGVRSKGPAVILLHGFPYDIHSYVDVAPQLAAKGCRVIVPYLRGFGGTRFLDSSTTRSGEQAAMGADVIALMDALHIKQAVLAGFDWGGRGACVAAALYPERCAGLVSVNGYNIMDLTRTNTPGRPEREAAIWYQFYFHSERGRAGLTTYRRDLCKLLWKQWSPKWQFDDATFDRAAAAFDNPDFVDVVIHSYRHRYGLAESDPRYADMESRLAKTPPIQVPTITLDGDSDGVIPASDGKAAAARFTGPRTHRIVKGAGHNLPQEAPEDFTAAILELVKTS